MLQRPGNVVVAIGLVVVLLGCAGAEVPAATVVVEGQAGTAVAAGNSREAGPAPDGVELAEVRIDWGSAGLRTRFTPRQDVWAAHAGGELGYLPVWSLLLWSEADRADPIPTYWLTLAAVGEDGMLATPSPPPTELDVWLCDRETYPPGVSTIAPRLGEPSAGPVPVCHRRSPGGHASFDGDVAVVEVPARELALLGAAFTWAAAAHGRRDHRTPGWTHCIPACSSADWRFPPPDSRSPFPGV